MIIDLKETLKPSNDSDDLYLGEAENYLYYVWKDGNKRHKNIRGINIGKTCCR